MKSPLAPDFELLGVSDVHLRARKFIDKWFLRGVLPLAGIVLFVGDSQSGKSRLLTALAFHSWHGCPVGDLEVEQARFLWCALEHHETEISCRLRENELEMGNARISFIRSKVEILQPGVVEALLRAVKKARARVIVFDCLRRLHSGNENESALSNDLVEALRPLRDAGLLVILIHHTGKSANGPRGSTDFLAGVDTVVTLKRTSSRFKEHIVKLCAESHNAAPMELSLTMSLAASGAMTLEATSVRGDEKQRQMDKAVLEFCEPEERDVHAIRNHLREGRRKLQFSNETCTATLRRLVDGGELELRQAGKKKFWKRVVP